MKQTHLLAVRYFDCIDKLSYEWIGENDIYTNHLCINKCERKLMIERNIEASLGMKCVTRWMRETETCRRNGIRIFNYFFFISIIPDESVQQRCQWFFICFKRMPPEVTSISNEKKKKRRRDEWRDAFWRKRYNKHAICVNKYGYKKFDLFTFGCWVCQANGRKKTNSETATYFRRKYIWMPTTPMCPRKRKHHAEIDCVALCV